MPEFPNPADYTFSGEWTDARGVDHVQEPYLDAGLYNAALAAAWEARARLAVEALRIYEPYTDYNARYAAREALIAIGPLPPTERAGG
jgi:hypothetical protein